MTAPGWTVAARAALTRLIRAGRGRRLAVAFDFDNTLVWGDIGEATLAMLVRQRVLRPRRILPAHRESFRTRAGTAVRLRSSADIIHYYETLIDSSVHAASDPAPLATGYVWAVEVMEGLSPQEIVGGTAAAFARSAPGEDRRLAAIPGTPAYPLPFFYPEMVELVGQFLRHDFDVWVVSASNVWTVRWMVAHGLNPLLRAGAGVPGIPPERVVGVATLLTDADGRLHKDAVLVREDSGYAALDPAALDRFRLSGRLQFPVSTYSGKVSCLFDALGERPYFAAGDSPGDHAMLAYARHRLWIARTDKIGALQATMALRKRSPDPANWIFQPVATRGRPGFLPEGDPGVAAVVNG